MEESEYSDNESIVENTTKKSKILKNKKQISILEEPLKKVKLGKKTTHS